MLNLDGKAVASDAPKRVGPVSTFAGHSGSGGYTATAASPGGSGVSMTGPTTSTDLLPMLEDILPDRLECWEFPKRLMDMYRDIYYHDSVGGSCVDLLSSAPFSNWTLQGTQSPSRKQKYMESLQKLNLETLCPTISVDYLVHGAFVGQPIFNSDLKVFSDILPMNVEDCKFTPLPLFGQNPIITFQVNQELGKFLGSKNPRARATLDRMGAKLAQKFKNRRFDLDPITSLFIARQTGSWRLGTSYFKRILPIWLIEKQLWRGTIIESQRRMRSILHLMVGDDGWEPTVDDMQAIASQFIEADTDPLGGAVATRNGVTVSEVRSPTDFWNIFQVWGDTVPAKLRALGISESFLSGEASYSNLSTSLTMFIDNLRAYRDMLTNKLLDTRLFPLIALSNGYIKNGKKLPGASKDMSPEQILHLMQDPSYFDMPTLVWAKSLEPKGDAEYFEVLTKLEEKGVPVHLRAWAAAGGADLQELMDNNDEDLEDRKKMAGYVKKVKELNGEGEDEGGEGEVAFGEESGYARLGSRDTARLSTFGTTNRRSLLANLVRREYGPAAEIFIPKRTGGFRAAPNQAKANLRMNTLIAKALGEINRNERDKDRHARSGSRKSSVFIDKEWQ